MMKFLLALVFLVVSCATIKPVSREAKASIQGTQKASSQPKKNEVPPASAHPKVTTDTSNLSVKEKMLMLLAKVKGSEIPDDVSPVLNDFPWTRNVILKGECEIPDADFKRLYRSYCVQLRYKPSERKANLMCAVYDEKLDFKTGLKAAETFYKTQKECVDGKGF